MMHTPSIRIKRAVRGYSVSSEIRVLRCNYGRRAWRDIRQIGCMEILRGDFLYRVRGVSCDKYFSQSDTFFCISGVGCQC